MPAVVSHRVETGPKDKLPPGAAEAEFAFHMARKLRDGNVGITVIEPEETKPRRYLDEAIEHPNVGDDEIEHDGEIYLSRRATADSVGVAVNYLSDMCEREGWSRLVVNRKGIKGGPRVYYAKADIESVTNILKRKRK